MATQVDLASFAQRYSSFAFPVSGKTHGVWFGAII